MIVEPSTILVRIRYVLSARDLQRDARAWLENRRSRGPLTKTRTPESTREATLNEDVRVPLLEDSNYTVDPLDWLQDGRHYSNKNRTYGEDSSGLNDTSVSDPCIHYNLNSKHSSPQASLNRHKP